LATRWVKRLEAELYESVGVHDKADLKLAGLSLWVLDRQFLNASDFWDGNWLNVRARVEASGAYVEVVGPWLRTDELATFATQLASLHQQMKGPADLICMEPFLDVKLTCGSRGQIAAVIEITPDHMTQAHQFKFEIDQSHIPAALFGCKQILERFPIVGSS
jgi:hypothetical protein